MYPQTQMLGHLNGDPYANIPVTHWIQQTFTVASNYTVEMPIYWTSATTNGIGMFYPYIEETPEERTAREAREAEHARKLVTANNRAEELLLMFIGEERKKQYVEKKYFDVNVNGNAYRIHRGRSKNIDVLENGEAKCKLCIHPADQVPDADSMLAQFLMLTTDEKRFLATANRWAA